MSVLPPNSITRTHCIQINYFTGTNTNQIILKTKIVGARWINFLHKSKELIRTFAFERIKELDLFFLTGI